MLTVGIWDVPVKVGRCLGRLGRLQRSRHNSEEESSHFDRVCRQSEQNKEVQPRKHSFEL
jgi:hypothetical protein